MTISPYLDFFFTQEGHDFVTVKFEGFAKTKDFLLCSDLLTENQ